MYGIELGWFYLFHRFSITFMPTVEEICKFGILDGVEVVFNVFQILCRSPTPFIWWINLANYRNMKNQHTRSFNMVLESVKCKRII